jgi:hypothetical protein
MIRTLVLAAAAATLLTGTAMADRYCGPGYIYRHYACYWVGPGPNPVGAVVGTAGAVATDAVGTAGYVAGSAVNAATGIATGVIGAVTGR